MNLFPNLPTDGVSDFVGPLLCPACELPLAAPCNDPHQRVQWWEDPEVINTPHSGPMVFGRDPEGVKTCYNQGCGSGNMWWAFQAMSEDCLAICDQLLKAVETGESHQVRPLVDELQDKSEGLVRFHQGDISDLLFAASVPKGRWVTATADHIEDLFEAIEEQARAIRWES